MSEWVAFEDGRCGCDCGEHHAKGVHKPAVCGGCPHEFTADATYQEAARPLTKVLRVSVLDVQHGLWCRVCCLPAGAQVSVSFNEGGVGTFTRCTCCGSDDVETDD